MDTLISNLEITFKISYKKYRSEEDDGDITSKKSNCQHLSILSHKFQSSKIFYLFALKTLF